MKTQRSIRVLAGSGAALLALSAGLLAAPHAKISAARANAVVLKRFPGRLTAKTTLENEEGKWQYGVMVRSGQTLREVMVDANTGRIANVEVTSAAKEGVEARQESAAKGHSKTGVKASGEKGERESGAKETNEKGEGKN